MSNTILFAIIAFVFGACAGMQISILIHPGISKCNKNTFKCPSTYIISQALGALCAAIMMSA